MAQEHWIAIRKLPHDDLHDVLSRYGYHWESEESVPNPGTPSAARGVRRPPAGLAAFYVFESPRWTVIVDSDVSLWEQLTTHTEISRDWNTDVIVVVTKATAGAYGYGLFSQGRTVRWLFRQGDVVGQAYGDPQPWEAVAHNPEMIGEILRNHFQMDTERLPSLRVVFARPATDTEIHEPWWRMRFRRKPARVPDEGQAMR